MFDAAAALMTEPKRVVETGGTLFGNHRHAAWQTSRSSAPSIKPAPMDAEQARGGRDVATGAGERDVDELGLDGLDVDG